MNITFNTANYNPQFQAVIRVDKTKVKALGHLSNATTISGTAGSSYATSTASGLQGIVESGRPESMYEFAHQSGFREALFSTIDVGEKGNPSLFSCDAPTFFFAGYKTTLGALEPLKDAVRTIASKKIPS